ncbi:hypothetical protein B0H66DRAFT_538427 [Apodospora peruviana]|uniref:Uncharacterized protein n=1 Tax=Apodospora peruviana TaxID=516989 RepID=A0AAE0HT46_9PEZI|nr:hypothetical protein B0H66DRAFT_538427 [Apodospora peruviana]
MHNNRNGQILVRSRQMGEMTPPVSNSANPKSEGSRRLKDKGGCTPSFLLKSGSTARTHQFENHIQNQPPFALSNTVTQYTSSLPSKSQRRYVREHGLGLGASALLGVPIQTASGRRDAIQCDKTHFKTEWNRRLDDYLKYLRDHIKDTVATENMKKKMHLELEAIIKLAKSRMGTAISFLPEDGINPYHLSENYCWSEKDAMYHLDVELARFLDRFNVARKLKKWELLYRLHQHQKKQ